MFGVSSNLLRLPISRFDCAYRHFCANFLTISKPTYSVKPTRHFRRRPLQHHVDGCSSVANGGRLQPKGVLRQFRAAHKYQTTASDTARASEARGRYSPGSCNGLFSVGFPTGALGILTLTRPNEPAPHFPSRAGHAATGRLHCSLATFKE